MKRLLYIMAASPLLQCATFKDDYHTQTPIHVVKVYDEDNNDVSTDFNLTPDELLTAQHGILITKPRYHGNRTISPMQAPEFIGTSSVTLAWSGDNSWSELYIQGENFDLELRQSDFNFDQRAIVDLPTGIYTMYFLNGLDRMYFEDGSTEVMHLVNQQSMTFELALQVIR